MTRLRARIEGIRHEGLIINTLIRMKNSGPVENTIKTTSQKLNQLDRNTELMNPREIETFIANVRALMR